MYDTATDMLAEAALLEDSGHDVTRWVKAYPEEARKLGVTQVVLDHTPKSGGTGKYAVGSRAKRAKAKVAYLLESKKRFDSENVGRVRVTLTKNTPGARIPSSRTFSVGGGRNEPGAFTFRPEGEVEAPIADAEVDVKKEKDRELETDLLGVLRAAAPDPLSRTKLHRASSGASYPRVIERLNSLVKRGLLTETPGPRGALLYSPTPDTPPSDVLGGADLRFEETGSHLDGQTSHARN